MVNDNEPHLNGKAELNGQSVENGHSGEITTIREILMGGQLSEFEKRFAQIEERLSAIERQLSEHTDQSTKRFDQLNQSLQSDFSDRIKNIESHFTAMNRSNKNELSLLFSEISTRLRK